MIRQNRPFRVLTAALLAAAIPLGAAAQNQPTPPPGTPAAEAQKRHEEIAMLHALDRLRQTEKNLGEAIAALQQTVAVQTQAPAASAPSTTGDPTRPAALQQAEESLHAVRRAIDEIRVQEDRRQSVLDRLDDADSAMRRARQPDAQEDKQRLAKALEALQQEVKLAQQTLPAKPEGN